MRLFVGLDIPEDIRTRIADFMREHQRYAPGVRWVRPESLHVTLKFIGEFGEQRLGELEAALASVKQSQFSITFSGTGFFPAARSTRVFWIGVHAGESLPALARAVDQITAELGIESEKQEYRPHLTLARKGSGRPARGREDRSNNDLTALQRELEKAGALSFGTMQAREFILYQSKLSPAGAQYTKLTRFPLAQD